MALAAPQARAVAVNGDERYEDKVGLDYWMAFRRLHDSEWTGFERIAGQKTEWLGGILEAGIGNDRSDGARFLGGGQRANLGPEEARSVGAIVAYPCFKDP